MKWKFPIVGGQKDRKQEQRDKWQEELVKKLEIWELENSHTIKPELLFTKDQVRAIITFHPMTEQEKGVYEARRGE